MTDPPPLPDLPGTMTPADALSIISDTDRRYGALAARYIRLRNESAQGQGSGKVERTGNAAQEH